VRAGEEAKRQQQQHQELLRQLQKQGPRGHGGYVEPEQQQWVPGGGRGGRRGRPPWHNRGRGPPGKGGPPPYPRPGEEDKEAPPFPQERPPPQGAGF
jgi:hypothetical protein